jgi:hypothetical protein
MDQLLITVVVAEVVHGSVHHLLQVDLVVVVLVE